MNPSEEIPVKKNYVLLKVVHANEKPADGVDKHSLQKCDKEHDSSVNDKLLLSCEKDISQKIQGKFRPNNVKAKLRKMLMSKYPRNNLKFMEGQTIANRYISVKQLNDKNLPNLKLNSHAVTLQINKKKQQSKVIHNANYSVSCLLCDKSFNSVENFQSHACWAFIEHKDGNRCFTYKCLLCKFTFSNINFLRKHLSAHRKNECKMCNSRFTAARFLKNHLLSVHGKPEVLCDLCGERFSQKCQLRTHLGKHVNEKNICFKCAKVFKDDAAYAEHIASHPDTDILLCKLCNKYFKKKAQYEQHLMGHERYSCSSCNVSFPTKRKWNKHQYRIHGIQNEKRPHVCNVCNKTFQRPMHLLVHLSVHSNAEPLQCLECKKSFKNETALAKHCKSFSHLKKVGISSRDSSTEIEKKYSCNECNVKFYCRQTLVRHIKQIHKNSSESMSCPYCEYSTKYDANFKRHVKLHTTSKQFMCEICGAAFHVADTLKEHTAYVHSDERNFTCDICSKTFKTRSSLKRHVNNHNNDRPFKCSFHCNRSYKQMCHLKRHMSSAHNITFNSHTLKKIGNDESDISKQQSRSTVTASIEEHLAKPPDFSDLLNSQSIFENHRNDSLSGNKFDGKENATVNLSPSRLINPTVVSSDKISSVVSSPCDEVQMSSEELKSKVSRNSLVSFFISQYAELYKQSINSQNTTSPLKDVIGNVKPLDTSLESHSDHDTSKHAITEDISHDLDDLLNLTLSSQNSFNDLNSSLQQYLCKPASPASQNNFAAMIESANSFACQPVPCSVSPSLNVSTSAELGNDLFSDEPKANDSRQVLEDFNSLLNLPSCTTSLDLHTVKDALLNNSGIWVPPSKELKDSNGNHNNETNISSTSCLDDSSTLLGGPYSLPSSSDAFSHPLMFQNDPVISGEVNDIPSVLTGDSLSAQVYEERVQQLLS